ncbi:hypothetical protein, variant [Aphanomyces astaci]|uniref:Sfi1 spindle body domain-containing protein n=1 Tax=Aphanomyces astaci TaxID=112090 RepID=W4H467_APHAT|nr:hypothetical protein, variant [Aphanomyces astaci]ETV86396.1 hypothetical protein, variant [Aphanomyces astaci]|eukprot:XP_009824868.1 hypothetical protein, variant [Aphanomyces astaci]
MENDRVDHAFATWRESIFAKKQRVHQLDVADAYYDLLGLVNAVTTWKRHWTRHRQRRRRVPRIHLTLFYRWVQYRDMRRRRRLHRIFAERHVRARYLCRSFRAWKVTMQIRCLRVHYLLRRMFLLWNSQRVAILFQIEHSTQLCPRPMRKVMPRGMFWQHMTLRRCFTSWKSYFRWSCWVRHYIDRPYTRWLVTQALLCWKRKITRIQFTRLSLCRSRHWANQRLLHRACHSWHQSCRQSRSVAAALYWFRCNHHRRLMHKWYCGWAFETRRIRLVRLWQSTKAFAVVQQTWQRWRLFLYLCLNKYTADRVCYHQRSRRTFSRWKLLPTVQRVSRTKATEVARCRLSSTFAAWKSRLDQIQSYRIAALNRHVYDHQSLLQQRCLFLWALETRRRLDKWRHWSQAKCLCRAFRRWTSRHAHEAQRTRAASDLAALAYRLMMSRRWFRVWQSRQYMRSKRRRATDYCVHKLKVTTWAMWTSYRKRIDDQLGVVLAVSKARQMHMTKCLKLLPKQTLHAVGMLVPRYGMAVTLARWKAFQTSRRAQRHVQRSVSGPTIT